ncbi:hypothetical protein ACFSUD_19530, partial [Sulfitobacter aestuarii]
MKYDPYSDQVSSRSWIVQPFVGGIEADLWRDTTFTMRGQLLPVASRPFPRSLARFPLIGLIGFDDPGEARRQAATFDDREDQYAPTPDGIFVEPKPPRELAHRLWRGAAQHIPQQHHQKVRAMDAAGGWKLFALCLPEGPLSCQTELCRGGTSCSIRSL